MIKLKTLRYVAPMMLATTLTAAAQHRHEDNFYRGVRDGGRGGHYDRGHDHRGYDHYDHDHGGIGPGKGALIGAGGGAVLGALLGGGVKGTIIGGAAGAGIGAVVGQANQNHRDRDRHDYYR
jgi:hypothetical protein